jgi:molybdate transport system substrate-binding protein
VRILCAAVLLSSLVATAADKSLLVFAAASTAGAVTSTSRDFQSSKHVKVSASFAGTNELLRQLKAGAKADLFLAADEASVDALGKSALKRVALLSNELGVIVPSESPVKQLAPEELKAMKSLSLADPAGVPAGKYAKAWLEKKALWEGVAGRVIPALDARAALAAVESGRAAAGIVYATDAATSDKVRVVYRVPLSEGPRIIYTLALLRDSPEAHGYFDYLQGDEARAVFSRLGFRSAK